MGSITVVHHNLEKRGGGEVVCMSVIEALEGHHDITLLTSAAGVDLESLNEFAGTDVSKLEFTVIRLFGLPVLFDYFVNILNQGLFHRYCLKSIPDSDLVISTWDELSINHPSIQYVHYPRRYRNLASSEHLSVRWPVSQLIKLYKSVIRAFANFDPSTVASSTLLANSSRTANRIHQWYNVQPQILNPPIHASELSWETPWEMREDGFVYVGRIHPGKRIHELIEIVTWVRSHGHEVHFHVIGPRDVDEPWYLDRIESIASVHDYVTLEGPMYGHALRDMLHTHKYGISGNPGEQFGMAVAEMVAAGMIPFVPNSGGQRNIVGEDNRVMFNSPEEAVEKILTVLSAQEPRSIRQNFPDIQAEYGKENFQGAILQLVDTVLATE
jgi:glycosyltransferase involved in cell wall biosynthesis